MSLMDSLQAIIDSTNEKILLRGEKYYIQGQIEDLVLTQDARFLARVLGSQGESYRLAVYTDIAGNVSSFACNCPHTDKVCKHLIAVFLAIQNGEYKKITSQNSVEDNLSLADDEKLKDFVLEYAKKDKPFRDDLLLTFGKSDVNEYLSEIKKEVREIIRKNTHHGFMDYHACDAACVEFLRILDLTEKNVKQGQFILAFSIALHILLTSVKANSSADSSSGSLGEVVDYALDLIDYVCEILALKGTEEEQEKVYEKCVKAAQNKIFVGWSDWSYTLLDSCSRLVTNKNVDKLYTVLDSIVQEDFLSYAQAKNKLVRLKIIERLNGKQAAEQFVMENIEFDEFRHIAVDKAMEQSDFETAEKLCLERLAREPNMRSPSASKKGWLITVYELYAKSNKLDAQIKIAEQLLLAGNLAYYEQLKALHSKKSTWEYEYPLLLQRCSEALPYNLYMNILEKENELALLLEQVKLYPHNSLFIYGKLLANKYPSDIYSLMESEIENQATKSTERKHYAHVCQNIQTLFKLGAKSETSELIAKLRQKFPRRPAMLDELAALELRLKL